MITVRGFGYRLFAVILAVSASASFSRAGTRYVSRTGSHTAPYDDWDSAATNLQSAIDVCDDGDRIVVASGDYYPGAQITVDRGVTVEANEWQGAVFHGGGSGSGYRGFELAHTNAVLDGVYVEGYDVRPANGGGVLFTAGGALHDCRIEGNRAMRGGNVCIETAATGARVLTCGIDGGRADDKGGGLYAFADALIERTQFMSNRSYDMGGAVYGGEGLTLRSCELVNNRANTGGAVWARDGLTIESSSILLSDTYDASSGALHATGAVTVVNTIIYHNNEDAQRNVHVAGGAPSFSHCCCTPVLSGPGNIEDDPLVRDLEDWDFELSARSPCIDAGTNQAWMAAGRDLWGDDRVWPHTVDLGPNEAGFSCDFVGTPHVGAAPLEVVFTAFTYVGNAAPVNVYRWDFDNDGTWDLEGPGFDVVTNVYDVGTCGVTLEVENESHWSAERRRDDYVEAAIAFVYVSTNGSHTPPYSSWATAAHDIQTAVDAAGSGTSVLITNGVYVLGAALHVSKAIVLRGVGAARDTILDGGDAVQCLRVNGGDPLVEGLTLRNGHNTSGGGGAAYLSGGTLRDCLVVSNRADFGVGGVFAGSGARVEGCTFRGHGSGALYLYGSAAAVDCTLTANVSDDPGLGHVSVLWGQFGARIEDCRITNNVGDNAGVLYLADGATASNCLVAANTCGRSHAVEMNTSSVLRDSTVRDNLVGGVVAGDATRIEDCLVAGNRATANGGGIRCGLEASVIVSGCTISNNWAASGGGVAMVGGVLEGCVIAGNMATNGHGGGALVGTGMVSRCTFTGNGATADGGGVAQDGGALPAGGCLANCVFTGNTAEGLGGGCYGGQLVVDCRFEGNRAWDGGGAYAVSLRQCVALGNVATNQGGGFYLPNGGFAESCTVVSNQADYCGGIRPLNAAALRNTIVYFNSAPRTPDVHPEGVAVLEHNCVPNLDGYASNFTNAPGFRTGCLELREDSYCVNMGTNQTWMTGAKDLAAAPRILEGIVDVGAYEMTNDSLNARFTFAPQSGTVPLEVVYTAEVGAMDPALVTFAWDFDSDGSTDATVVGVPVVTQRWTDSGVVTASLAVSAAPDLGAFWTAEYPLILGATHYVATNGPHIWPYTSWATAATNIPAALAASKAGDDVVVSNGVYELRDQLNLTNGVCLRSLSGPAETFLHQVDFGSLYNFRGINVLHADAVVDGFTVEGFARWNDAVDGGNGGGVYLRAPGTVRNCVIRGNQGIHGGGVATVNGGTVYGCNVYSNEAAYDGGGLYLGNSAATTVVDRCRVRDNSANEDGGGIYMQALARVSNSLVAGNEARGWGSGSYVGSGGGIICVFSGAAIRDCTVTANTALRYGGGIALFGQATTVSNSIVHGNRATLEGAGDDWDDLGTGSALFSYSCAPHTTNWPTCTTNAPWFADAVDFRLSAGSPCVDSGSAGGAGAVDLDGVPRPLDGDANGVAAADMGCYEFVHPDADTDGDTLPDRYEIDYGTGATASNDPTADPDGDGMSLWEEYVTGTDPNDPNDVFAAAFPGQVSEPDGLVIAWASVLDRLYTVYVAPGLLKPWTNVHAVAGTGGVQAYTNSGALTTQSFFRVGVSLYP